MDVEAAESDEDAPVYVAEPRRSRRIQRRRGEQWMKRHTQAVLWNPLRNHRLTNHPRTLSALSRC